MGADGIYDLGGDLGNAAGLGSGAVEYEREFTNGDNVPVSGTGTLFLQFNAETTNNFVSLGLSPANPTSTSLATPFRLQNGTIRVGQDDGTGYDDTGLTYIADTTYSVWLVADNDANLFDAYIQGGAYAAQTFVGDGAFQPGAGNLGLLSEFFVRAEAGNDDLDALPLYLDNIYVDTAGQNLTNPIPEPSTLALIGLGGLALTRRKPRA